jgi:hypothetical protein
MNDKWAAIIYDLTGSCNSLAQILERHDAIELEDNLAFLTHLDSEIFLCDICGWWCEISEAVDVEHGIVCDQCYEDEE